MNTLHTLRVVLAALGLPVATPIVEVPGYAIVAARTLRRAIRDNEPTEQERAEFGCPTSMYRTLED